MSYVDLNQKGAKSVKNICNNVRYDYFNFFFGRSWLV